MKLKKICMIFMMCLCFAICFSVSSSALKVQKYGDFSYVVMDNGKIQISAYSGDDTEITFPSEIENKTVEKIGGSVLMYGECPEIVNIPSTIKYIVEDAFDDSENVQKFVVSEQNKYYSSDEQGVLFNKDKTTLIKYPIGNTENNYTIPEGTVTLAEGAFIKATHLENISFPESLLYVSVIDFNASAWYESQPDGFIYLNKVLLTYKITDKDADIPEKIEVKKGTTAIAAKAFSYEGIKSVVFPDSLKVIGREAFADCYAIEKVTIPLSVTDVGYEAFRNCEQLKTVRISDKLYKNYDSIFSGSTTVNNIKLTLISRKADLKDNPNNLKVKSIVFTDKVKTIAENAFSGCIAIKEITIGKSVKTIPDYALSGMSALKKIVIPKGVSKISLHAFYSCEVLREIVVETGNKYFSSVDGVLYNKKKTELIYYPVAKSTKTFTIPETVKKLHHEAIKSCNRLEKVVITKNVKAIGRKNFFNCKKLRNFTVSKKNKYYSSAEGCVFNKNGSMLLLIPSGFTVDDSLLLGVGVLSMDFMTRHMASVHYIQWDLGNGFAWDNEKVYKSIKLSSDKYTYDGKVKTPKVTIYDNLNNKLVEGTDYKLTYSSGRKKPGKYSVKIKFKGYYEGSKKVYFKILPKK